jgi:hypothetical protein
VVFLSKKVKVKKKEFEKVEIMPNVNVPDRSLSWFMQRMFMPEDDLWIWIRRMANILTIPTFIIVLLIAIFK